MDRRKGSTKAMASYKTPSLCEMTIENRMQLIASIIVDRIIAELEIAKTDEVKETNDVRP